MGFHGTGTPKPLALVATLPVSLLQSDPLGLNATPLPQDSSLVETPLAESRPRKQQLAEEQPSGNGVKKPKVSFCGLWGTTWYVAGPGWQLAGSLQGSGVGGLVRRGPWGEASQVHTVLEPSANSPNSMPLTLLLQIEIPVTPTGPSVPSSPNVPGTPTLKIWGTSPEDKQQAALLRPTE